MVTFSTLALGLLAIASQVCAQQNIRIMPFGASIVSRCWRADLQTLLRAGGATNFDFVGGQKSTCTGGANIDQDHEGHPGFQAADIVRQGSLVGWLDMNNPDVILMLLGTNDVLIGKRKMNDIIASYDILIAQMRKKNANIQIVISNLLPLDTMRWPPIAAQGIKDLNAALATYMPTRSTIKSGVYFVDNFEGFDAVNDTDDGEHPNLSSGVQKIAKKFLEPTKTAMRAAAAVKAKRVKRAERIMLV